MESTPRRPTLQHRCQTVARQLTRRVLGSPVIAPQGRARETIMGEIRSLQIADFCWRRSVRRGAPEGVAFDHDSDGVTSMQEILQANLGATEVARRSFENGRTRCVARRAVGTSPGARARPRRARPRRDGGAEGLGCRQRRAACSVGSTYPNRACDGTAPSTIRVPSEPRGCADSPYGRVQVLAVVTCDADLVVQPADHDVPRVAWTASRSSGRAR